MNARDGSNTRRSMAGATHPTTGTGGSMWFTHRKVITVTGIAGITALLSCVAPLRAQTEPANPALPQQAIDRDAALQHGARLRAEAVAHREMANEVAGRRGGSRRERRWNGRVVELCRQYATDAEAAATAYEALAAQASKVEGVNRQMSPGEHAIVSPPSTAEEYKARATEYEQRAAEFRADADRHAAMVPANPINVQTNPGGSLPQRPVVFQSPREQDMRAHCIEIVRRSTDLARDAEEFAKHYALRGQQLAGTK